MDAARELRELRRIEQRLTASDPELAAMLRAHGAKSRTASRRWRRFAVDVLGAVFVAVGALTVSFTLVFLGVLALMTGACLHVTCRRQRREGGVTP